MFVWQHKLFNNTLILLRNLLWQTLEGRWNHRVAAQAEATAWKASLQKRLWGSWWTPSWPQTSNGPLQQRRPTGPLGFIRQSAVSRLREVIPLHYSALVRHIWRAVYRSGLPTVKEIGHIRANPASVHEDDEVSILGDTQNPAGHGPGRLTRCSWSCLSMGLGQLQRCHPNGWVTILWLWTATLLWSNAFMC